MPPPALPEPTSVARFLGGLGEIAPDAADVEGRAATEADAEQLLLSDPISLLKDALIERERILTVRKR